jgi:hypothetical protein
MPILHPIISLLFFPVFFFLEMVRQKYSGWALRHLEVNFPKILFLENGNQCIAEIAEALPGLQTLNGVTRLE